ncbi:MAG: Cys-tRNA(Pro) deacylase [Gammaproteobacteria bacterium]
MTPAITAARRARIDFEVHEYEHDPDARSFGLEAAEKLGLAPARVLKTLVVALDGGALAVGIVPVDAQLDMKQVARALGAKKAAMATREAAERATGYVMGGISPLGQKKRLPMALDASAQDFATVYVSGGRRGLDLELAPADLVALTGAVFAPLAVR